MILHQYLARMGAAAALGALHYREIKASVTHVMGGSMDCASCCFISSSISNMCGLCIGNIYSHMKYLSYSHKKYYTIIQTLC